MNRILILGDDTAWQWHPLSTLEPLFDLFREKNLPFDICTDYGNVTTAFLSDYPLIINYIDNWKSRGTQTAQAALLKWLAAGNHMVTIHNGIILDSASDLQRLHGASFSHHDPFCELTFSLTAKGKSLFTDPGSFSFCDEPYEFILCPAVSREVFLEYSRGDQIFPAGWKTSCGKGAIWYFCPGHTPDAVACPAYLQLLSECIGQISENTTR